MVNQLYWLTVNQGIVKSNPEELELKILKLDYFFFVLFFLFSNFSLLQKSGEGPICDSFMETVDLRMDG